MEKKLVTRNEVRELGLNVSSTQFQRYENDDLLTPIKPGNRRSARVYYELDEVYSLLRARTRKASNQDVS